MSCVSCVCAENMLSVFLYHGGEEGDQDTEKPEGHPMTMIDKGDKGHVISCDDFDLCNSHEMKVAHRKSPGRSFFLCHSLGKSFH